MPTVNKRGPYQCQAAVRKVGDNSAMENFFSSLKAERTVRKAYCSREQVRPNVFNCMRFEEARKA